MDDLSRFRNAQDDRDTGFDTAMDELRAGRKRSHWIWYVFPQIAGLGSSDRSRHFGVRGRQEAEAYLRDDVLRSRLLAAIALVLDQLRRAPTLRLDQLMGSRVDALKLVSSLTLFETVASELYAREPDAELALVADRAGQGLAAAAAQGYARCAFTLRRVESA